MSGRAPSSSTATSKRSFDRATCPATASARPGGTASTRHRGSHRGWPGEERKAERSQNLRAVSRTYWNASSEHQGHPVRVADASVFSSKAPNAAMDPSNLAT